MNDQPSAAPGYLTLCTQLASARDVHGATALCPTPGPLTSAPAGGGTLTFLDPTTSCARPNSPWPATTTIFCPEPTAVHIFIDSCASKSRTHTSRPDDEATPVDTALAQARSSADPAPCRDPQPNHHELGPRL
ncbi:hypothetical protein ACCO45_000303 [Purpureocillium lilacinum]|uniref:Uncharacterized protein n=1 Tax=Purpureocillium lilacinum TaxID=33203 RepID=A0ACC4E6D4_PURLI